jgi:hypothetical protein
MQNSDITVLFTRSDSIYKSLGCDTYDINRDARSYAGDRAVIAHPPCRAWGRLKAMAKPRPDEKELARFAVKIIQKNGGVLEHPQDSSLWKDQALPEPGSGNLFAKAGEGFSIKVNQFDFGHKAIKGTWLYINGMAPDQLPTYDRATGEPAFCVQRGKYTKWWIREITKKEREATPEAFALYLIEIVKIIEQNKSQQKKAL